MEKLSPYFHVAIHRYNRGELPSYFVSNPSVYTPRAGDTVDRGQYKQLTGRKVVSQYTPQSNGHQHVIRRVNTAGNYNPHPVTFNQPIRPRDKRVSLFIVPENAPNASNTARITSGELRPRSFFVADR